MKKVEMTSAEVEIKCICCEKTLELLYPEMEHDVSSGMYNGGMVNDNAVGYGSVFDGDIFVIGVCDKCIEKKSKSGVIIHRGRYF